MTNYSRTELLKLVEPGRVHRKIYVDPELFELEIRHIFYSTWMFVAHESQVALPGEFFSTRVGRQPILVSRHQDGKIYVHYNRCAHRGALLVNTEYGCAKQYKCMYHGWTYEPDGRLAFSPRQEVEEKCGIDFEKIRLTPVEQWASYRGFVFVKLCKGGQSLPDFLGPTAELIDDFVDASPDSKLEVSRTCHRYVFDGNWKHFLDQGGDTYHTLATHASTLNDAGVQFKRRSGEEGGQAAFQDLEGDAKVLDLPIYTFPNGHVASGSLFDKEQAGGDWEEYRRRLVQSHGVDRARELMNPKYHDIGIFPTMGLNFVHGTIDVTLPIAVDKTELRVIPVRRLGAPESLYRDQIRYANQSHGAAGHVRSDDAEAFRRVQLGLMAEGAEWVSESRGMGREQVSNRQIGYGDRTSEIGQRHVHRRWVELLTAQEGKDASVR